MTIREFIELQMKIYRIEPTDDNFNKIKVKTSRELKKIDSWHKLENKQPVGKTSAFILDEITKKQLEVIMKPYFIKLAKINLEDFEKEKKFNMEKAESIDSPYHKSSRPQEEAYFYTIPNNEKMFVMIEALFNERFVLDEQSWNEDYTNYRLFFDDEEALTSDSLALSNLRLQNPLKYYVKKK